MSRGSFKISPPEATKLANTLNTEEEQIVSDIRGSIQIAQHVAATFKGATATSYQSAKADWDSAIMQMDEGMKRAIQELRSVINNYTNTDDELSGIFRR